MRKFMLEKVREAEKLAEQAPDGSETRAGWTRVANSWRLLAERLLTEHPGDDSTIVILH